MLSTKLALLVNLYGGVDALAEELEIPEEIIESSISGGHLSRGENAELNRAFAEYELRTTDDLDTIDALEERIESRYLHKNAIVDPLFWTVIREEIANGNLEFSDFEINKKAGVAPMDMFLDITTPSMQSMILSYLLMPEEEKRERGGLSFHEILQKYVNDRIKSGGLGIGITDSEFYAWFREIFYPSENLK